MKFLAFLILLSSVNIFAQVEFVKEDVQNAKKTKEVNPDSLKFIDRVKVRNSLISKKSDNDLNMLIVGKWNYVKTIRTNSIPTSSRAEKCIHIFKDHSFKITSKFDDKILGNWNVKDAKLNFNYNKPRNPNKNNPATKNWPEENIKMSLLKSNFITIHKIENDSLYVLSTKLIKNSKGFLRFIYDVYSKET